MKKIRLFTDVPIIQLGTIIILEGNDFNYVVNVMRKKNNDEILIFNGEEGEWVAQIIEIKKKSCSIKTTLCSKKQYYPPNITLAFSLIKSARVDFIAQKATELGVVNFQPLISQHSVMSKINEKRFFAHCKEAAEQCERLEVPKLLNILKLEEFLKNVSEDQIIIICDESGQGDSAKNTLSQIGTCLNDALKNKRNIPEVVILIGPEGGFSNAEFIKFNEISNLYRINLGPRILRADTAAISSLTLVQEFIGDFYLKANF